jgi:hypothetical protein
LFCARRVREKKEKYASTAYLKSKFDFFGIAT